MAKGKHAAALFEVIHSSRQASDRKKVAGLLRTPKWWFKGRDKEPVAPPAPVSAPAAEVTAAPAEDTTIDYAPAAPRPPAVDVLVDSQRHQLTFRVSYTSAIVAAFSIIVVVALAYLVGRSMNRGPTQALGGVSTERIRQGPARPDVLDVGRGGAPAGQPVRGGNANIPVETIPAPGRIVTTTAPPNVAQPNIPATSETGRRISGLNYVIIQSYPDEANAKAAVQILKQHGVGCTIEKGLRGLKSDWFIVVGTDGFSRVRSTEFEAYIKKIEQISDKFANRKSFKAFQPFGYKWDRP